MGPNYIALAVPLFFLLIGIELALLGRRRAKYRFASAVSSLACGMGQRVTLLFYEAGLLVVYALVYKHVHLLNLETRPALAFAIALLGVDFVSYWWHRASHRVNFLWAAHIVHHQSEDFNLAVALRQGVFTPITSLPFSLPLAVLGVPPLMYVLADALDTLYQFWIHTELVRRLGPLEAVMNTPSHHRVHHGRNPRYLDRNYGGVFIFWDRLFGTFAEEREKVVYGITHPLRSFNPLWAQLHHFGDLARRARAAPTVGGWFRAWLGPPDDPGAPHVATVADAFSGPDYDVPVTRGLWIYVLVNFGVAVAATFALMMWASSIALPGQVAGALFVLLTTATMGGLMESRPWARTLERARLACVGVALPAGAFFLLR